MGEKKLLVNTSRTRTWPNLPLAFLGIRPNYHRLALQFRMLPNFYRRKEGIKSTCKIVPAVLNPIT